MKTLIALLLFPLVVNAQYDGPGVETCRLFAQRQLMRDANTARSAVIERDQALVIERYTRKVGNQFVASILTGNGAVVFANAPSAELAFICLLADDKRAVFFEWLPRRDASAMTQCTRDETTRANPRSCLQTLLDVGEIDLTQAYANRLHDTASSTPRRATRRRAIVIALPTRPGSNTAMRSASAARTARRPASTPATTSSRASSSSPGDASST